MSESETGTENRFRHLAEQDEYVVGISGSSGSSTHLVQSHHLTSTLWRVGVLIAVKLQSQNPTRTPTYSSRSARCRDAGHLAEQDEYIEEANSPALATIGRKRKKEEG